MSKKQTFCGRSCLEYGDWEGDLGRGTRVRQDGKG